MKKILVMIAGVTALLLGGCLSGCTSTSYTDPSGAKFSRVSFLNNQSVGRVEVQAGDKKLTLESYNSQQTEFAAAVVGAAIKAGGK